MSIIISSVISSCWRWAWKCRISFVFQWDFCFVCSAGMREHDVIISINGKDIHTTKDVSNAVQSSTLLSVMVRRKDGDVMLTIALQEKVWGSWLQAAGTASKSSSDIKWTLRTLQKENFNEWPLPWVWFVDRSSLLQKFYSQIKRVENAAQAWKTDRERR